MPDDLEAFLKQVARNRVKRKQAARAKPPIRRPTSRPTPAVRSRPTAPPPAVEADLVSESIDQADERFAKVDSQFDRDASRMGHDVEQADDSLEAHMHATFDHRLGALDSKVDAMISDQELPTVDKASVLAQMLHDPKTVVLAILLSEVLQPPEHRW